MIDKETLTDIQKITNLLTDDDIDNILQNQISAELYDEDLPQNMENQKLRDLVEQKEKRTGLALVDVQNWLHKDAKELTRFENQIYLELLKESKNE